MGVKPQNLKVLHLLIELGGHFILFRISDFACLRRSGFAQAGASDLKPGYWQTQTQEFLTWSKEPGSSATK